MYFKDGKVLEHVPILSDNLMDDKSIHGLKLVPSTQQGHPLKGNPVPHRYLSNGNSGSRTGTNFSHRQLKGGE